MCDESYIDPRVTQWRIYKLTASRPVENCGYNLKQILTSKKIIQYKYKPPV